MKQTIVFLIIGIIFPVILKAQNQEFYLTCKLFSGCPIEIEPFKKQFGIKDISYATLETGTDSINVIFGEMTQGACNGYWVSLYCHNKLTSFSTVTLEKSDSSEIPTKKIDIEFDKSAKRISVQVMHQPSTDKVVYTWLNNNAKSKKVVITNVVKPIQENRQFPTLELESIKGENISTKDFAGKYIVINWWHTGCVPCRTEIPGLNALVEKFKATPDIIFLAISPDKKDRLENYLKNNEFKYLQTFGNKEIFKIFGGSFPKNIIVNPKGNITYYSEGGDEKKHIEIEESLKKQLDEE